MKTFVVVAISFLAFASPIQGYSWEPFNGNFPQYEYPFTHFGVDWHYCKVNDNGMVYTGTVNERDQKCVIVLVGDPKNPKIYDQFDILIIDEATETPHFGADMSRGIDCEDAQAPDCKLGMSVFADQLCFRNLAKVSNGKSYLVDGDMNSIECPFSTYMYLDG